MPRPQRFPWQLPSRHMPLLLCHGGLECVFTNGSSHWIFRGVNPVTIVLVKDVQVSEIGVLHPRFFQSQWPQHALVSVLAFQIQPEIAGYERMKLMEYTGVYTGDEANSIGRTSEMKSGNYSIDKKATSEATPRKQPTHSQLQSAWRAFERYSEASPKK